MRAVRIEAWQTMCNYKKPGSFQLGETYPLPPYSTVIGLVHALCGYTAYEKMQVSIAGRYHSIVNDMFTEYTFGPGTKYEKPSGNSNPRFNTKLITENGDELGISRGTSRKELLVDVHLILHICPENQEKLEEILQAFLCPREYPSLGRREDLLRIDSVRVVELKTINVGEDTDDSITLLSNAYIPVKDIEKMEAKIEGTVYRLHKVFETGAKNGLRQWGESVFARYASINSVIDDGVVTVSQNDSNGELETVFLA